MSFSGKIDDRGFAPGETLDSFRRVSMDTLAFVAMHARSAARRQLAMEEMNRRRAGGSKEF